MTFEWAFRSYDSTQNLGRSYSGLSGRQRIMVPIPSRGRRYPYPCWLQRALVRFELARKNSQKPFSSNVPAASSRTARAAASSLAVNR